MNNGQTKTLLVCSDQFDRDSSSEHAQRAAAVASVLQSLQGLDGAVTLLSDVPEVDARWVRVVHESGYLGALQKGDGGLWASALRDCGAVCAAVDHVLLSEAAGQRAFCAAELSGHQAGRASAGSSDGVCLLNNVVVGAKYALLRHDLRRIAVVDFDGHHGAGSEELLAGDDNFLYVGLHHAVDEALAARAAPNMVSFTLPAGKTRAAFRAAVEAVLQRLRAFGPELIMLSAGFDGHRSDALGLGSLQERDYFALTAQICELAEDCCSGRVVSVLEGGFGVHSGALVRSVEAHVLALAAPPNARVSLLHAATAPHSRWTLVAARSVIVAHEHNQLVGDEGAASAVAGQLTERVARKRERVASAESSALQPTAEDDDDDVDEYDDYGGDMEDQEDDGMAGHEAEQDHAKRPRVNGHEHAAPADGHRPMAADDAEEADDDDGYYPPEHAASEQHLEAGHGLPDEFQQPQQPQQPLPLEQPEGAPHQPMMHDEDELVVDILDEDADSQEGSAREGLDLQLDYELSERSYTEAMESRRPARQAEVPAASAAVARLDSSHSSGGHATLRVTAPPAAAAAASEEAPRPAAAAAAAGALDFDEINALIGEELGDL